MEKVKLLNLKLIGFKEIDVEKFSAILDLAEFGLEPAWQIVNSATADFYLLTEKPKTNNYKGLPRERCFFYGTGVNTNTERVLHIDSDRTPKLHSLVQLLNRMATQVDQLQPIISTAKSNLSSKKNISVEATTEIQTDTGIAANQTISQTTNKSTPTKNSQPVIAPISYTLTAQINTNTTLNPIARSTDTRTLSELSTPSSQLSKNETPPKAITNQFQSEPTEFYQKRRKALDPQKGLLKSLVNVKTPLVFTLQAQPDFSPIYVNPEQNTFYCSSPLELLTPYFKYDNSVLTTTISTEELNRIIKKESIAPSQLRHLIWYTAFKCSRGKLIQGLTIQDTILLKQLPYVGPDSRDYIHLAAFLKKRAASLEKAAQETGISLELAINFYNASYLAGLIEKITKNDSIVQKPIPEKQSLLDKIKNHLKS